MTGNVAGLTVGATSALTANITQTNCTNLTVAWGSNDSSVVRIASSGVLSVLTAGGPVTITATANGVSGTIQLSTTFTLIAGDVRTGLGWAYQPNLGTYSSISGFEYNSNNSAVVFARSAIGVYSATFTGLATQQGQADNVQVVAYGNGDVRCKLAGWGAAAADMRVDVLCFDHNGVAADAMYDVFLTGASALQGAFAFALAPSATAVRAFGAARTTYTANRAAVPFVRSATGQYLVTFPGLAAADGSPISFQVTAVGAGSAYCLVAGFTNSGADVQLAVRCYGTGAVPADAQFSALMLGRGRSGARSGFLWADQEAAELNIAHQGKAAYTYSSSGTSGAAVTHTGTGTYLVAWPNLARTAASDRETMLVTALGSTAAAPASVQAVSCSVVGWQIGAIAVTVACRDASGALVDAQFFIALLG